jgi:hypothetical protein
MIRRFYILPLKPGTSDAKVDELVRALDRSDQFIPGLLDSSAGVDLDSRTALWENNFVDEETYSGPYMVHPYHIATLDNYVMMDSPECVTHDIYTSRYQLSGTVPRIDNGIRRLVLMNIAEGADVSPIETLATQREGVATSVFCPDNVGWVSAKGRPWTHIWEQGFTDMAALHRYLKTREGVACSSLEGFKRLGVDVQSIKILTCPFQLKPAQSPAPMPPDDSPALYTITARTAVDDADDYVALLERHYDQYIVDAGGKLIHRWRSVDQSYGDTEVQSTWQFDSIGAYSNIRAQSFAHPDWHLFVRDAMPLVKSGTRRFYRAV